MRAVLLHQELADSIINDYIKLKEHPSYIKHMAIIYLGASNPLVYAIHKLSGKARDSIDIKVKDPTHVFFCGAQADAYPPSPSSKVESRSDRGLTTLLHSLHQFPLTLVFASLRSVNNSSLLPTCKTRSSFSSELTPHDTKGKLIILRPCSLRVLDMPPFTTERVIYIFYDHRQACAFLYHPLIASLCSAG